jgi:hypothetical protein
MDDKSQKDEPKLPPPGFVRPLTDPEAVMRWFAIYEPAPVLTEWDPFSPERMRY